MNEVALQLGPDRNLVAMLTPAEGSARPVGVLVLNAGVIHRIGPHRTSVKIARSLAAQGWPSVRFDISGIGDSRAPRDAAEFRVQAVADIRAVMDHLEQELGIGSFALFGICAGAVNAHASALADPRVVGAFMIDGYIFSNWKCRLHWLIALLRAYGLRTFATKALRNVWRRLAERSARTPDDIDSPPTPDDHPTREQYARQLQALADRGVQMTLMNTGSFLDKHAYARQWHDLYRGRPFMAHIECLFDSRIDHTMTTLESQRRLLEQVGAWMRRIAPRQAGS